MGIVSTAATASKTAETPP